MQSDRWIRDIAAWVLQHEAEYIEVLIRLIHIRSVAQEASGSQPFGNGVAEALDYVLELSEKYGLQVQNDEYYCGSAILPGNRETYAAGHLSVVQIAVFGSISTICSMTGGILFLHEPVNFLSIIGAVFILAGIWQVNRYHI